VDYKFIVDTTLFKIKSIYADVVLGKNIKGMCTDRLYITQSISVQWLNTMNVILI
jgi:hypothetical protein